MFARHPPDSDLYHSLGLPLNRKDVYGDISKHTSSTWKANHSSDTINRLGAPWWRTAIFHDATKSTDASNLSNPAPIVAATRYS
jgi:hypothetical protein